MQTRTPAFRATVGGSMVTILYSNPASDSISSGTASRITPGRVHARVHHELAVAVPGGGVLSKVSASAPGTPYHVFGAPQCM